MVEWLTKMGQRLQLLGRESATTTPALNIYPSMSDAFYDGGSTSPLNGF